jgi:hypothetical protein
VARLNRQIWVAAGLEMTRTIFRTERRGERFIGGAAVHRCDLVHQP